MSLRTIIVVKLLFGLQILTAAEQYVTYDFSGGRFGDCLISYLHAKWFSYKHDMPLIYKPFEYSSFLVLHDRELRKTDTAAKTPLHRWPILSKIPGFSCTYKCPYFSESLWERRALKMAGVFNVDWTDKKFRAMVRELIQPKGELDLIRPPKGMLGVAVHVREGGGWDQNGFAYYPTKFPPLSFYVDGLKAVRARFPQERLYCQLFTDALDPDALAGQIRKALPPDEAIEFHYRKNNNVHDANVLEDFFSLFEFDVLIRPDSNFSMVPSLIHDYAMVYAVEDYDAEKGGIIAKMEINR